MAAALHAALSDVGVSPELYNYCHFEIYPRVVHDADAGRLPDDPQGWFRLQLQSELQNTGAQAVARRNTLERAAQLVAAVRLSPLDVAAMLTQAGAPQPVDPAAIIQLATVCLVLAMEHQAWTREATDWEKRLQNWRTARELSDKLRSLLSLLIKDCQWLDAASRIDNPRTAQFRMLSSQLENLDFEEPVPGLLLQPTRWHNGAVQLAKVYRVSIDPETGWSRGGPAVRFLVEALRRAYPRANVTKAAIETLLIRQLPRRARNDLRK